MEPIKALASAIVFALGAPAPCFAAKGSEAPNPVPSFDGFVLPTFVSLPPGVPEPEVTKVVVFVHGSGPSDADGEIVQKTPTGEIRLTPYKDLAAAFQARGMATVRYHKRSHEMAQRLKADPTFANSDVYRAFQANPFKAFVEDAAFFAGYAKRQFPKARLALFGHSEGTQVSLQASRVAPRMVDAVALAGFTNETMASLLLEQIAHRPLAIFEVLDTNRDQKLSGGEMAVPSPVAQTLKSQLPLLDVNGDGAIEKSEFMAGNYLNVLVDKKLAEALSLVTEQQSRYPRPVDVVESATFPIVFLQGEWDNQTPLYGVQAVEMLNKAQWKKGNLKFVYFPKTGHGLDPRDGEGDLVFKPIAAATLAKAAEEVDALFTRRP